MLKKKKKREWYRRNLSGKVFENAIFADAVLEGELLPELHSYLVTTLPHLQRDYLPRHGELGFMLLCEMLKSKAGKKKG